MRIRKAIPGDYKKIIALMQQMPDFFSPETIAYAEKSITKLGGFVACMQKDIVGYIVFGKKGKTTTKIYRMGVVKNYQGKGIGAALFTRCEKEAKSSGSKKIELLTLGDHHDYPGYQNTRKFYEKRGCVLSKSCMDEDIELLTLTKKLQEQCFYHGPNYTMEHTEQQNETIHTERLKWELLSMKYIQEIFKELTDEVTKYLRVPTPTKIEQEEQRIINSNETYKKGENINFIVTDEAGDFIGTCGVTELNTPTPELGLRLKESARGKGYGKEMIAGLINRLQAHKKFDYIVYRAHVENVATNKIATSFGGKLLLDEQGNTKILIEHKFDNSSSFEAVEYRIPKK